MVSKDYGNFNSGDSINPKKSKLDAESLEKLNKMKLEELLKQALSGKKSYEELKEFPNLSEAELQKIQEQIQKEINNKNNGNSNGNGIWGRWLPFIPINGTLPQFPGIPNFPRFDPTGGWNWPTFPPIPQLPDGPWGDILWPDKPEKPLPSPIDPSNPPILMPDEPMPFEPIGPLPLDPTDPSPLEPIGPLPIGS